MSYFLGFRFLSDYFWEFKIISIVFIVLSAYLCVRFYLRFYVNNLGHIPKFNRADIYLFSYFSLVTASFFTFGGEKSLDIYVKITAVFLAFYLGKVTPPFNVKKIYLLYFPIFTFVFITFITGSGFQYWGNIETFSGGYFYKTDLALALTLFIAFLLVGKVTLKVKLVLISIVMVLIFKANSRMYLLISMIVVVLYFYRYTLFLNVKRFFIFSPLITILIFFAFYFINDVLKSHGLLSIDFNDFFSGKNLQGRDLLWENLLISFYDFPFINKLIGFGLVKDVELAYLTGFFESSNAHNTYIYNLISVGLLGSFFFLAFMILTIKKLLFAFEKYKECSDLYDLLYLCFVLLFIFILAGFTATVIPYLQLSWFCFFFLGILYNVNFKRFNQCI